MLDNVIRHHLENEAKYQLRKHVATEIRRRCPDSDPMVGNITVMLGSILAMAAFYAIFGQKGSGRSR